MHLILLPATQRDFDGLYSYIFPGMSKLASYMHVYSGDDEFLDMLHAAIIKKNYVTIYRCSYVLT